MKKTALLSVLILMTAASTALAAPWKQLGTDGKHNYYFYKPKTLQVSKDNIISTWTKKEYGVNPAELAKKSSDYSNLGAKTIATFEEYNCAEKTKRTITGQIYEVGKERFDDVTRTDWAVVKPGTMDEDLLNALCKEVKK